MTDLADRDRTEEFLALVSVATEGSSRTAIRLLAERMGPAGLLRLKALYEVDSVVQPAARSYLAAIAEQMGW